jgi:hypothetical protein
MKKAIPVEMRKALEAVNAYKQAGILFVPIPVLDDADHVALIEQASAKLEKIVEMCEKV